MKVAQMAKSPKVLEMIPPGTVFDWRAAFIGGVLHPAGDRPSYPN